jgi:N utilization substance protein A|tara:strand:+ start:248 stop:661 length:414 start_codon:yes stop_codon:yes gene_type:complete
MKIIYDQKLIQYLTLFENMTRVKVKDVFLKGELVYYVVWKKDLAKAIGPKGMMIKKIENMVKRRLKVVAYSDNVIEFVKDLLYGFDVEKVEENEGIVKISCKNVKTKGLLIGRERKNLSGLKDIILRYFKIKDLQVT